MRRYLGDQDYKVETIATADDVEDANGVDVLDFWASSRGCPEHAARSCAEGYIVADAVADYLEHLEGRASWRKEAT